MPASVMSVARALGQLGHWSLSNLELQKMAYMAEMLYMGRNNGAPLILEHWQAWDNGPVEPTLYHKAKVFGADPVKDIFHAGPLAPNQMEAVAASYDMLSGLNPGQMVAMTHWRNGAWAKHYSPGIRNRVIPKSDILQEYRARVG